MMPAEATAGSLAAFVAAAVLAAVHLFAGRLGRFRSIPRSRALSVGSGISVAYVFVHLLPELAATQEELEDWAHGLLPAIEHHVWVVALGGLAAMYGLERAARLHRHRRQQAGEGPGDAVAWVHLASYAAYNGVVGALLVERAHEGVSVLWWFAVAMAVHFVVNDHGLAQDSGGLYRRRGRWLVASGTLAGWAIAATVSVSTGVLGVLTAVLGGGVILNVLKEELPEDRESSFGAFAAGAVTYSALLLAT